MPRSQRTRFQDHYEHVEDIDLFSGGISELPLVDGIVGPLFACIMGIQFNHLKFGDSFYFEHGGQAGSFNEGKKNLKNDHSSFSKDKILKTFISTTLF